MKKIILCIIVLCSICTAHAEPDTIWVKSDTMCPVYMRVFHEENTGHYLLQIKTYTNNNVTIGKYPLRYSDSVLFEGEDGDSVFTLDQLVLDKASRIADSILSATTSSKYQDVRPLNMFITLKLKKDNKDVIFMPTREKQSFKISSWIVYVFIAAIVILVCVLMMFYYKRKITSTHAKDSEGQLSGITGGEKKLKVVSVAKKPVTDKISQTLAETNSLQDDSFALINKQVNDAIRERDRIIANKDVEIKRLEEKLSVQYKISEGKDQKIEEIKSERAELQKRVFDLEMALKKMQDGLLLLEESQRNDQMYFRNAAETLTIPFKIYFDSNKPFYPDDNASRKMLVASIVQMAFQYYSLVMVKAGSQESNDDDNYATILGRQKSSVAKVISNHPSMADGVSYLVLYVAELLRVYNIESLDVNLRGYIIRKKDNNE